MFRYKDGKLTAVITDMIAVIGGSAATSKNYSSYSTAVIPKESGKHMRIRRVVHTRSATAMARAQIPSEFDAVTCGVEKAPPAGLACLADWRLFLAGLSGFLMEVDPDGRHAAMPRLSVLCRESKLPGHPLHEQDDVQDAISRNADD